MFNGQSDKPKQHIFARSINFVEMVCMCVSVGFLRLIEGFIRTLTGKFVTVDGLSVVVWGIFMIVLIWLFVVGGESFAIT